MTTKRRITGVGREYRVYFRHPRLWRGWKWLMSIYGYTPRQVEAKAQRAMHDYEGVSSYKIVAPQMTETRRKRKPFRSLNRVGSCRRFSAGLAAGLFTNGAGERAETLRLILPDGRSGGSWDERAMAEFIAVRLIGHLKAVTESSATRIRRGHHP